MADKFRKKETGMDIEITMLMVGAIQTNCYIVNRKGSTDCIVIDPGDEAEKIASYLEKKGLSNQGILLTHGHFDHIMGVSKLQSLAGGTLYAYEGEKELLADPGLNVSYMVNEETALEAEVLLRDGQTLEIAGMDFTVIHTPGHTTGSCCYYLEQEKILFSGDTIFMESVGRTDFPTGNGRQLLESIRSRVLVLPPEVQIYPGHGPETSVAYEKQNNPYA